MSTAIGSALSQLLLAFEGTSLPADVRDGLAAGRAAGVTLFRPLNVTDATQLRALTDEIQAAAPAGDPLIVALDHEGGQLIGLGHDATPFAGNLALGAAADPGLARRVASAIGRELRAVGVNVDYAPVCDLATNPANPSLGIRSFGDDPHQVAALVAATVLGLREAGVAATLKHFPGAGEAADDPHHMLPVIAAERARLEAVELVPFRAGIAAGAALMMTGHPAMPGLTGDPRLPATFSPTVLRELLRGELGFGGVTVSDALDMGAVAGPDRALDPAAMLAAGQDLLMLSADPAMRRGIEAAVGAVTPGPASVGRVRALRSTLQRAAGEPAVVGCAEHRVLARELAAASVTLVRDTAGLLPLRPGPEATIGAIMVRPVDRTPADTSSTVVPGLAHALRRHHPRVDELIVEPAPSPADVAAARAWAAEHDLLVVGSLDASFEPAQAAMVQAILDLGLPTVTLALRTPWDLGAYPTTTTHVCTYSVLPPSLEAASAALWGTAPFRGRLPVAVPDG